MTIGRSTEMYRCRSCGEIIEEPYFSEICLEDYNGVSDIFPDRHHYITVASCTECWEPIEKEYDYYDEEDEEDEENED